MQDRVPLYPGRVKLTPVSGQENVYDMVRADQPTQDGDPLNKATLLKDATAALFGLGTDAVPDDALKTIGRFHSGLGNEYLWAKHKTEIVDTIYSVVPVPSTEITTGNYYSDEIVYDPSGYNYAVLKNPTPYTYTQETADVLVGKYIAYNGRGQITKIEKLENALANRGIYSGFVAGIKRSVEDTLYGYVNSPDANAYPPAESDGFEYLSLGQLGDKARIVTGSYVGTGQYGSENPNSLTFEFAPKVLFIIASVGVSSSVGEHMWKAEFYLNGVFSSYKSNGYFLRNDTSLLSSNSLFSMLNSGGKSVLWYGSNANTQLNATEETYYYTAIG